MARILLVDDDESVRPMLRLLLAHFGHSVVEARNGREGLALFSASVFDLVITDLVMPEIEGLEVLMQLRKKTPTVKIIAMSGGGRSHPGNYLKMAQHLGAAKVLKKPFSNEVFIGAVEEVLQVSPRDSAADDAGG